MRKWEHPNKWTKHLIIDNCDWVATIYKYRSGWRLRLNKYVKDTEGHLWNDCAWNYVKDLSYNKARRLATKMLEMFRENNV